MLRFWETRFTQIKPMKRGGGRRYYRPDDVDLLRGIRFLLYGEGYTIRGVQRILKEQGPRFVIGAGRGEFAGVPGRRRDQAARRARGREPIRHRGARRSAAGSTPVFEKGEHVPGAAPAVDADERRRRARGSRSRRGEGIESGPRRRRSAARHGRSRLMVRARGAAVSAGLSREDAERLKATLVELLELKRILDQAR